MSAYAPPDKLAFSSAKTELRVMASRPVVGTWHWEAANTRVGATSRPNVMRRFFWWAFFGVTYKHGEAI